jgi:hypothetical protein
MWPRLSKAFSEATLLHDVSYSELYIRLVGVLIVIHSLSSPVPGPGFLISR